MNLLSTYLELAQKVASKKIQGFLFSAFSFFQGDTNSVGLVLARSGLARKSKLLSIGDGSNLFANNPICSKPVQFG